MSGAWVSFGDVARQRLGMQAQYASRYVGGHGRAPDLSQGLRFQNTGGKPLDAADYHDIEIHADDVEEFVLRVTHHRRSIGAIP